MSRPLRDAVAQYEPRVGELVELGVAFIGASIIVGADGWPVSGPASKDRDELLIADVDLNSVEQARRRTPRNHLHTDRRPDEYRASAGRAAPATGAHA